MKRTFKRLFKTAWSRFLLVWLAANFIRIVYYTNRRRINADEGALPYMRGEKNAVFAFWHGRMMMIPHDQPARARKMNVLISSHRDGEMIARTMHQFGFATVRGSTSRGALTAGKGSIKALQDGGKTSPSRPTAPRGPALKVQKGAASIAAMAGVPVIPVTFSATRRRHARAGIVF